MAHQDQIDQRSPAPGTTADDPTWPSAAEPGGARPVVPEQRGERAPAELVVSRGPETGLRYPVPLGGVSIGRQRESDVVLDDPTVSRAHAQVSARGGGFVIADSGSLNGTYVNRRPVDVGELSDGDEVWIGKVRFVFRVTGA